MLTHLEVEELAVASVNDFCAAIAPGHFDDVNLAKQKRKIIRTCQQTKLPSTSKPLGASLPTHSAIIWRSRESQEAEWGKTDAHLVS